jgi:hypothetical protein
MSRLFAAVILICFAASACDAEDQPQRIPDKERRCRKVIWMMSQ